MKKYVLESCFVLLSAIAFFVACKKEFGKNEDLSKYDLLNTYSEAFKNEHNKIAFIGPDRLAFERSVFVSSGLFGDGYLIPISTDVPRLMDTESLQVYAYFIPDKNEILEITVSAPGRQKSLSSEIIKYLSGGPLATEMTMSIVSENNGLVGAQTKDGYMYIVAKRPDNNTGIFRKADYFLVQDCPPEDVWYIVRFFYNIETGAIVDQVIIGSFCGSRTEISMPGGGGITGGDTIKLAKAFVKSSCLDSVQDAAFNISVTNYYAGNCTNKYIYKYNIDHQLAVDVCMDSTMNANATYNPSTATIKFSSIYALQNQGVFGEEFFHAFQNSIYSGGISQYNANARGNIEFEYQLQKDIASSSASTYFSDNDVTNEYVAWLSAVTNDFTTKPTANRELNVGGHNPYTYFLEKFSQDHSYSYSGTLLPLALFYTSQHVIENCN